MFGIDFGTAGDTLINIAGHTYNYADPGDKGKIMLLTAGLGLAVVFLVLIIIFLVLSVFNAVYYAKNKKSKTPAAVTPEISVSKADEVELIAVIGAAVNAYLEEKGEEPASYRVVSFKRK